MTTFSPSNSSPTVGFSQVEKDSFFNLADKSPKHSFQSARAELLTLSSQFHTEQTSMTQIELSEIFAFKALFY
jgi:hypothetical protein